MSIETSVVIDKIEVVESNLIQVRQATVVTKNGSEIARSFERWVLSPGDDLNGQDERVKMIANVVWTKEVVDAFKAAQAQTTIT